MRAIVRRLLGMTSVMMLTAACGAQPNQPLLANAPRPNPSAIAGGAAAAAAAITLADPDAASRKPEKKEDTEKKPIKVKESVPASVLDRLDHAEANKTAAGANGEPNDDAKTTSDAKTKPSSTSPKAPTKPANLKLPRDPLDFDE
jgi:hypothetical protein